MFWRKPKTYKYLIRRTYGDFFSLHKTALPEVFSCGEPYLFDKDSDMQVTFKSGTILAINFEEPGFHLIFSQCREPAKYIASLIDEMAKRLTATCGEAASVQRLL